MLFIRVHCNSLDTVDFDFWNIVIVDVHNYFLHGGIPYKPSVAVRNSCSLVYIEWTYYCLNRIWMMAPKCRLDVKSTYQTPQGRRSLQLIELIVSHRGRPKEIICCYPVTCL